MRVRLGLILCLILCFLYVSRNFILDDGLIYARYISNALHGNGLVFNQGERINALTSPLFAYLLLLTSWMLHGNVILAEQILFAIFFAGACILAERLIPYSGIAMPVMAFFYVLIGMESTLFLFMLMLAVTIYVDSRVDWIPLVLILTLLTRFEGGLLIPIVGWNLWRERKFPRPVAYIPAVAILIVYLYLNHHWYGAFLPSSTTSKILQGFSGYWGKWPTAFLRAHIWAFVPNGVFRRTIYIVPMVAILSFYGWKQLRQTRLNNVAMPFFLSISAFYLLFNIPSYHWYWAPLIFFSVMYAVQAIPKRGYALVGMVAILLIEGVTNIFFMQKQSTNQDYVYVAKWIRNNTPTNAVVASVEIGDIGWYCDRRLVDILGLTHPENARHIAHRDVTSWLREDSPDYIVMHRPTWPWEKGAAGSADYSEIPVHSGDVYLLKRNASRIESASPTKNAKPNGDRVN